MYFDRCINNNYKKTLIIAILATKLIMLNYNTFLNY